MATISGSKRLLNISGDAMAASNSMTYGGLNVATESYVSTQISNLISSAPGALDTLNELAAALGDDPNFATTMTNALAGKLSTGHDMTLTLNGDASGSATFTNMSNATLTVVVANDSHTHDGRYYTETEVNNLLAGKLSTSGKAADSNLLDGINSTGFVRYDGRLSANADTVTYTSVKVWDVSTASDAPDGAADGLLTTKYWDSSSWAVQNYHDFHTNKLFIRSKQSGTWQTEWAEVWTTDNFNPSSYLTTSGKAADSNLLDGLDLHTGRNNQANKVVRTDSNGYIQAGWINTPSGAAGTINKIYASQDDYVRYLTPANFRTQVTDAHYDAAGSASTAEANAIAHADDRIENEVLPAIPTNNNQLTNGAGYITDGNTGWNNSYGFITNNISTGITINGSLSRGTYTSASQYHTGADNIVLKGNSVGISGIFFESEKDGTNINHASDFGFIQFHPYGTGTSGESNELIIGVSNDADDHVIVNAPNVNGFKFRTGASATDYTVWHAGNFNPADKAAASHTHSAADITSGTLPDARIASAANWNSAYNNYITGVAVTGTTTKTITLTQRDGGTISGSFTDLSGAGGDGNDFLINGGFDPASEVLTLEVANQAPIEITLAGTMTDTDTNTWRGIHDTPVDGATTTSISSNWAFDNVKTPVPAGAVFTDNNTTYSAGTGLTLSGTTFSVTAGTYAAASHNHTSLNLTGSIYNGSANYSIDLKDHSDRTWFRNQVGGWTFQTGTSGDDWTQSFTFYLPAAGTTANNVWAEFGQRDSNDAAAGRYRGLRIVKDTGSVADGDLRAGAIYIGTTRRDANWTTAYNWGNHASAGYASDTDLSSVNDRIDNEVFPAINGITLASLGYTGATNANYITNNNQLTNGAGYITDGNTGWNNTYGFITASSTNTLTNKSGNISQWTNDSGYLTSIPTTLSGNRTIGGDLTVSGNQVITSGSNADVKFSVWSGTTYGIGMTSGVTYGGLNDYAMTFCMNNDSDRGFWWGYSGQSKSAGAMSLTTGGILTVASSITAGGDITAFSDVRVKENIQDLEGSLDKVTQLRGVSYNRIDTEERSIGVIAQEIQEVLPEVVREGQDGMLSVAYGNITAVLIEAIKEQQEIIAQLEERIVDLENRM